MMPWVECVVADSVVHAQAMRRWLGLDDAVLVRSYGDPLPEHCDVIHIVRPLRGPSETHIRWIVEYVRPRARKVSIGPWAQARLETGG